MGFVINEDTYRLKFSDGRYAGMVIEVTDVPTGVMLDLMSLERGTGIEHRAFMQAAWAPFLASLVSWNLEYVVDRDTGETRPVPHAMEALEMITLGQFTAIYRAWMNALTAPSEEPDLGKDSSSGATSPAELPMTDPS